MSKSKTDALEARSEQRRSARELLLAKKPRVAKVFIVTDDDLVLAHDEAVERLAEAAYKTPTANGSLKELQAEVDRLRKAVDDATVCIKFHSIGAPAYEALINEHQPTEAQVKEATKRGGVMMWNPDSFPVALIHASICEPDDLALEDVETMWATYNAGERSALFTAAIDVNTLTREVAEAGNVSGGTRTSSPSSTTAPREASLTPSS